jgi:YCII-related domain
MTERSPDTALEDRVVRALIAAGDIRPRRPWRWGLVGAGALAAALLLLVLHPWSPPRGGGATYALLLYDNPSYQHPAPGHLPERIAEYARWADSLDRLGELQLAGRLDGPGEIGGLFIVRAKNEAQADSVAAASPHAKYGGRIEVRRFIQ